MSELENVVTRLRRDKHFAEVTAYQNGKNLKGWLPPLSPSEIEKATEAARSLLVSWSAVPSNQGVQARPTAQPQPTRLGGQYDVLGQIGEGGFGVVFKAHDTHLEEIVAIKELQLDDPSALRDEAKVLSKLRHENVVGFRQLFFERDRCYLVIDFVEGGSLSHWIASRKLYTGGHRSALQRLLTIARQFAEGLSYAHKHQIVHQDVKPGNVLITSEEVAKVSDFGLARARPVAKSRALQQSIAVTGAGCFSVAYCSPEQSNGQRLTTKTDTWSWGLSVLEMFTGSLNWMHGTAATEALDNYLTYGPEDEAIPFVPEELASLLRNCFVTEPGGRPSMEDCISILSQINSEKTNHPALASFKGAQTNEEREALGKALSKGVRFASVGNGTIIDTKTRLMWADSLAAITAYSQAERIVRQFRSGGYRDWRLPSPDELLNLCGQELIFPDVFAFAYQELKNDKTLWTSQSTLAKFFPLKRQVEVFSWDSCQTSSRDSADPRSAVLPVRSM